MVWLLYLYLLYGLAYMVWPLYLYLLYGLANMVFARELQQNRNRSLVKYWGEEALQYIAKNANNPSKAKKGLEEKKKTSPENGR